MYASTFVAFFVCVSCVNALSPTILAFNTRRAETTGAKLLGCFMDSSGNIRCRPASQRSRSDIFPSSSPDIISLSPKMMEEAQQYVTAVEDAEDVAFATPEEVVDVEAAKNPSSIITLPDLGTARILRCAPYEIYVPELDRCEDVVAHLKAPRMTDPRVGRWYSWRNFLLDARHRSRGF
ncbi:uncharacterized protein [Panulirus ornatus]|uniref:uncharacterized protein n=1 Tax=Panulirus ornatus TaxID=150431 RepID=UPI003A88ABF3